MLSFYMRGVAPPACGPLLLPPPSFPHRESFQIGPRFAASRPGWLRADPEDAVYEGKEGFGPCGRAGREPFGPHQLSEP